MTILVYYVSNTPGLLIFFGGEDVNFDSGLPIYMQIVDIIKTRIVTGILKKNCHRLETWPQSLR